MASREGSTKLLFGPAMSTRARTSYQLDQWNRILTRKAWLVSCTTHHRQRANISPNIVGGMLSLSKRLTFSKALVNSRQHSGSSETFYDHHSQRHCGDVHTRIYITETSSRLLWLLGMPLKPLTLRYRFRCFRFATRSCRNSLPSRITVLKVRVTLYYLADSTMNQSPHPLLCNIPAFLNPLTCSCVTFQPFCTNPLLV